MQPPRPVSILVVDDEPDICTNLRDILTDLDYHVDTAGSGLEALRLVEHTHYDVALLDLKMPGMSGLELYRAIKQRSSQTVAIIISAFASTTSAAEAIEAGAWRILSKPVDFAEVLQSINEVADEPLVMVVDDDEALCASLWDVLRGQGIRAKLAYNLADAEATLDRQDYQVAIVDWKLPGGDGLTFCDRMRAKNKAVKLILMTGFRSEVEERAESLSIDAACFKPFDVGELLALVRRMTAKPSG